VKVLRPTLQRVVLLAVVVVYFQPPAYGRPRIRSLPGGVCGDERSMLEAAQAGRAMAQQVLSQGTPWGGQNLNEYVNRLGQNLARISGSQQVFTFFILYNPSVNAQSFPGGFVVVNSGVISSAESEAELASVLSHEIAHVNACDWRVSPWKGNLFKLLVLVPAVAFAGPAGIAAAAVSDWAEPVARARFGRSAESRADWLGTQYLALAGYDPMATVKMFARLEAEESNQERTSGGLLATHPRLADRQRKLEKKLRDLPPPEFHPPDETEFQRMRAEVRQYDKIYFQVMGLRGAEDEPPLPALLRRPQEKSK